MTYPSLHEASRGADACFGTLRGVQTVDFYDRWVNGSGLRLVQLASGEAPSHQAPEPSPAVAATAPNITLDLERYDGAPELPALDAEALLPISHVLVHGSMATHDSCAFSDVDIAVIVDDRGRFSPELHRAAVLELRRLLHAVLAYDPLMHHGLMFFPASGLACYDQRFLPLETLKCARVLHGPSALNVHLTDAPASLFRDALRRCAASLRKHVRERTFLNNDYRLKNFLSGALLMPARILAARGIHVYKRDSFEIARELFARSDWEFILRCEGLRAFWKTPREPMAHRLVPNNCHPSLRQVIGLRMSPTMNARRLSKAMTDGLLRSAERFLDRVEAAA
jgi:predicted nucleotidyltransferase